MELNITHLYPDLMNLYGDLGNVVCLQKRAEWRGIKVTVNNISIGSQLEAGQNDLYFFGGGQDADQLRTYPDLLAHKRAQLLIDLESDVPMLAICGGYQLLGKYFLDSNGNRIEGIGLLDMETVAPTSEMRQRAVGDLVTRLEVTSALKQHPSGLGTLVGFENHSGRTRLNPSAKIQTLGKVLVGVGDNFDCVSDGIVYKHVIGSYMHGSLLPKNPHLADWLITKALTTKYKTAVHLKPLDDTAEIAAHRYILTRHDLD